MARYLITKSLISSWQYIFDCAEGYEDDAYNDFLSALRREERETPEAAQNGIAFENAVYRSAAGKPYGSFPAWEQGIQKVASIIRGATVQVRVQREITVDGTEYLVYGILDALKAGIIYDVKFKNRSFSGLDLAGNYLESPQHPAYLYMVPEAREFQYLVSDGEDLYVEKYTREDTRFIGDIIGEFIRSITGMGLLDEYHKYWATRDQGAGK